MAPHCESTECDVLLRPPPDSLRQPAQQVETQSCFASLQPGHPACGLGAAAVLITVSAVMASYTARVSRALGVAQRTVGAAHPLDEFLEDEGRPPKEACWQAVDARTFPERDWGRCTTGGSIPAKIKRMWGFEAKARGSWPLFREWSAGRCTAEGERSNRSNLKGSRPAALVLVEEWKNTSCVVNFRRIEHGLSRAPHPAQGTWTVPGIGPMTYFLQEPSTVCSDASPCPLVVTLHGADECSPGTGPSGLAGEGVFGGSPGKENLAIMARSTDCWQKLRAYVLIPQLPCKASFRPLRAARSTVGEFVVPLVKDIISHHSSIDEDRVIVTGYGTGGQGCMFSALSSPDVFSFAVCADIFTTLSDFKEFAAVSSEGLNRKGPRRLETLLITQALHDKLLAPPHERAWAMSQFLESEAMQNYSVHYRLYKWADKNSWSKVYYHWPEIMGLLWEAECRPYDSWMDNKNCTAAPGGSCVETGCCLMPGMTCFAKNEEFAACKSNCTAGIDKNDAPEFRTPWSCKVLPPIANQTTTTTSTQTTVTTTQTTVTMTTESSSTTSTATTKDVKDNNTTSMTSSVTLPTTTSLTTTSPEIAFVATDRPRTAPAKLGWAEMNLKDFPGPSWAYCSGAKEAGIPADVRKAWIPDADSPGGWPIFLEGQGDLCRLGGSRYELATGFPALVWVAGYQEPLCQLGRPHTPAARGRKPSGGPRAQNGGPPGGPHRGMRLQQQGVGVTDRRLSESDDLQQPRENKFPVQGHSDMPYYLVEPPDGSCTSSQRCPLVLHLHDEAEAAPGSSVFSSTAGESLAIMAHSPTCREQMRTYLLLPQLSRQESWGTQSGAKFSIHRFAVPLLLEMLVRLGDVVDRRRVMVAGYGTGGHGCMLAALSYPEIFISAVCSDFSLDKAYLKDLASAARNYEHRLATGGRRLSSAQPEQPAAPRALQTVVIAHGEADTPPALSKQLANLRDFLRETRLPEQASVQVRVLQGVGQGAWAPTFNRWPGVAATLWTATCSPLGTEGCSTRWAPTPVGSPCVAVVAMLLIACFPLILEHTKSVMTQTQESDEFVYEKGPNILFPESNVISAFKECTKERPTETAVAISTTKGHLDYQELAMRMEKLANVLRQPGLLETAGDIAASLLDRGLAMAVTYLAVLKAGGTLLPVAADPPQEYLAQVFESNVPRIVVGTANQTDKVAATLAEASLAAEVLVVDPCGEAVGRPEPLRLGTMMIRSASRAMLLLTSGSSGRPKSVVYSHSSLYHSVHFCGVRCGLARGTRVLASLAPTAAGFQWQVFGPLSHGSCCVMVPQQSGSDPTKMAEYVHAWHVGVLMASARLLEVILDALVDYPRQPQLQHIISVGEQATPYTLKCFLESPSLAPAAEFHNCYGTTESCIVTWWTATRDIGPEAFEAVPVGRPEQHGRLYILERETFQRVKPGQAGEVFLGGVSGTCADGYLAGTASPEDDKRFIPNPFGEGMLYRTGDIGKWQGGQVYIIGRADREVRVRGVSVSPEEVEACLRKLAQQAAVVPSPEQEGLLAYVGQLRSPTDTEQELLAHCTQQLPRHMVPLRIFVQSKLPSVADREVDLDALSKRAVSDSADGGAERVLDSLGRVRFLTRELAWEQKAQTVANGVVTLVLLMKHWLPRNGGYALQRSSPFLRNMVLGIGSSNSMLSTLSIFVGLADARKHGRFFKEAMHFVMIFSLLYLAMGLPRWLAPSMGIATFHRWSCLAFVYIKLVALGCSSLPERIASVINPVMTLLAAAAAPFLRGIPIVPSPSEVESGWTLVYLEQFPIADMAAVSKLLFFYLLGFAVFPRVRSCVSASALTSFCRTPWISAILAWAALGVHLCLQAWWSSIAVSYDQQEDLEWPGYFNGRMYPLRLLGELGLDILLMLFSFGASPAHAVFSEIGSNLVAVYLCHLLIQPDFQAALWWARRGVGEWMQLPLLLGIPALYALSVGRVAQTGLAWGLEAAGTHCRSLHLTSKSGSVRSVENAVTVGVRRSTRTPRSTDWLLDMT